MPAPKGYFHGEFLFGSKKPQRYKATGEYRAPLKGEYYLSGAEIHAYKAPSDFTQKYWIAAPVQFVACTHCNGTGEVEKQPTRQEVIDGLAKHYSAKLKGEVWAGYDEDKHQYFIRGEHLPAHPDLKDTYPNGWSLLDYITPTKARQIVASEAK